MRLTPTELDQILYDAAECSCPHCQRVRRMAEHVKAVERENVRLKGREEQHERLIRHLDRQLEAAYEGDDL